MERHSLIFEILIGLVSSINLFALITNSIGLWANSFAILLVLLLIYALAKYSLRIFPNNMILLGTNRYIPPDYLPKKSKRKN